MKKKNDVHVHVGFFHSYLKETNKINNQLLNKVAPVLGIVSKIHCQKRAHYRVLKCVDIVLRWCA